MTVLSGLTMGKLQAASTLLVCAAFSAFPFEVVLGLYANEVPRQKLMSRKRTKVADLPLRTQGSENCAPLRDFVRHTGEEMLLRRMGSNLLCSTNSRYDHSRTQKIMCKHPGRCETPENGEAMETPMPKVQLINSIVLVILVIIVTNINPSVTLLPDPELVIRRVVASSTKPELRRNVDIALLSKLTSNLAVNLPRSSTKGTCNFSPHRPLRCCPLLETLFVHIITTCCFAKHNLFFLGFKWHVTDATVFIWRVWLAIVIGRARVCGWYGWRLLEDLAEFGGDESELVL